MSDGNYCRFCGAPDLLERIAALEAAHRWIPVSERLPPVGEDVYTVVEWEGKPTESHDTLLKNGQWTYDDSVTHWRPRMPLPAPPKEQGE